MRRRLNRGLAIGGALLGWTALVLQLLLFVRSFEGAGSTALAAVWRYTGFFTIWSNLLAAVILTRASIRPTSADGLTAPRIELAAATAMVVVDAIYSLVLRQIYHPVGLDKLADIGLHDTSPVVFVLYWLTRPHRTLRLSDIPVCLVLPLVYCAAALARGAAQGWYPYPFLDATVLGPARLALNCLGLGTLFLALGIVFWVLDKGLARLRAR